MTPSLLLCILKRINMIGQRNETKVIFLLAFAVVGSIYCLLISSQWTLTGINHLDGIIGVILGLFICSRPAANLVDMFFYRRGLPYPFSSNRSVGLWIVFNILVLLIGSIAIFTGTTRFIGRGD